MMLTFALMLLFADPTPPPKVEAAKPRTAALQEIDQLKLENISLRFQQAQAFMEELKRQNDEVRANVCKKSGFAKCTIDGQAKLVTETKE